MYNAQEAYRAAKENRDTAQRKANEDFYDRVMGVIQTAVSKGCFQTEIQTNVDVLTLDHVIGRLEKAHFDVKVKFANDFWANPRNYNNRTLWIGWADDQCEAAKVKALPQVKKASKAKRAASTRKRKAATPVKSAPTV